MLYKKIKIKEEYNVSTDAELEILLPHTRDYPPLPKKPLILVIGGGGYAYVSHREKDPVAISFMKRGFASAILTYTVGSLSSAPLYPKPHLELMASIDFIRKHADEFNIDPNKIVVIGFSAGGHLAASYGYLYKNKDLLNVLNVEAENVKPNYLVLAYPVISTKKPTHQGTKEIITGNKPELIDLLCVEEHIDKTYPVSFIWNTLDDAVVPAINSNLLADALKRVGVNYQLLQYPHGSHGLSMIDENTVGEIKEIEINKDVIGWFDESIKFLNKEFNK